MRGATEVDTVGGRGSVASIPVTFIPPTIICQCHPPPDITLRPFHPLIQEEGETQLGKCVPLFHSASIRIHSGEQHHHYHDHHKDRKNGKIIVWSVASEEKPSAERSVHFQWNATHFAVGPSKCLQSGQ